MIFKNKNEICFVFYILPVRADESPETLETAKQNCEDWFVNQGEELGNIFFDYVKSPTDPSYGLNNFSATILSNRRAIDNVP